MHNLENTAEQCPDFMSLCEFTWTFTAVKNTRQIVISQLITNLIRIFKLKLSLSFLLCVRAGNQGTSDNERERERDSQ